MAARVTAKDFIKDKSGNYWMVQGGKYYPVPNFAVFDKYGVKHTDIPAVAWNPPTASIVPAGSGAMPWDPQPPAPPADETPPPDEQRKSDALAPGVPDAWVNPPVEALGDEKRTVSETPTSDLWGGNKPTPTPPTDDDDKTPAIWDYLKLLLGSGALGGGGGPWPGYWSQVKGTMSGWSPEVSGKGGSSNVGAVTGAPGLNYGNYGYGYPNPQTGWQYGDVRPDAFTFGYPGDPWDVTAEKLPGYLEIANSLYPYAESNRSALQWQAEMGEASRRWAEEMGMRGALEAWQQAAQGAEFEASNYWQGTQEARLMAQLMGQSATGEPTLDARQLDAQVQQWAQQYGLNQQQEERLRYQLEQNLLQQAWERQFTQQQWGEQYGLQQQAEERLGTQAAQQYELGRGELALGQTAEQRLAQQAAWQQAFQQSQWGQQYGLQQQAEQRLGTQAEWERSFVPQQWQQQYGLQSAAEQRLAEQYAWERQWSQQSQAQQLGWERERQEKDIAAQKELAVLQGMGRSMRPNVRWV